jgi:uncharacterized protein (TIGR00106 family)
MAIVEVSVVPLGTGSTSLSRYVADCIKVLDASGLDYELHGMGTIIEGALQDVLAVIRQMHEVPFKEGAQRVVTSITVDDRRDKTATAKKKVQSVIAQPLLPVTTTTSKSIFRPIKRSTGTR